MSMILAFLAIGRRFLAMVCMSKRASPLKSIEGAPFLLRSDGNCCGWRAYHTRGGTTE